MTVTQLTGVRFSNDTLQLNGVLNTAAMSSAITLRCLQDINHDTGLTPIGPDSGAPYREVMYAGERKPELTTSVSAISTLMGALSALGTNCMTADGSHPGVQAFMESHNPCAANGRTAGSNHEKVTIASSQILITGLGGQVGQTAYANIRVVELSTDGEAEPHAIVFNVALPSSYVFDEAFVITEPTIAGYTMDPKNVVSWQIDPGVRLTVIVPASSIFPTAVDIEKVPAKFTMTHNDGKLVASLPESGFQCAHADTYGYFRQRTAYGGLVAKATTSHVKWTMAGFGMHTKRYSASGSGVASGEITIEALLGAGGVPLTVTTGVAIT